MFWFVPFILGGLGTVAAAAIIGVFICGLITPENIRETVEREALGVTNAFKYKILEAKGRAVRAGIFNESSELLNVVELESDTGVSTEIRVNKWEFL